MSVDFNSVLLHISNSLDHKQLDSMKFLCRELVKKNLQEKITSGHQLFQSLSEKGKLDPQNTVFLCSLLTQVGREDLAVVLERYEGSKPPDDQPDDKERARLDVASAFISERVGRWWRKLGRRLGVSEVKLESISKKHPSDLEETALELLAQWRRTQGQRARAQSLVDALRACDHNLTADLLEERLAQDHDSL